MRPLKTVADSRTEQIHMLRYEDINGEGRLFGGKLIAWIDEVAGICARRHSQINITTASIDNLIFKRPAYLNEIIAVIGHVTYVGNTSLEVRVDAYLETADGMRHPINRAYVTMVAINMNNRPIPIPFDLTIETEGERGEWESAKKRVEMRKQRRSEGF